MEDGLKYCVAFIGLIGTIGGFLYWHFKTINGFKDDIHRIEIKQKELEHRDSLQQQTIDQLDKLYPFIKEAFEKLTKEKK